MVLQAPQSLRARLLLLLFLVVLPPSGLLVFTAVNNLNKAEAEVASDAIQLAHKIARQPNDIIPDPRYFLENLSKNAVVMRADSPNNCNLLFAGLLQVQQYFINIAVSRLNGEVSCSGLPSEKPVNVSDRSYFRRALESREFAIGDYQIGRRTGKPDVVFASPVFDPQGRPESVVYLSLGLSWLNEVVAKTTLPAGSMATVLDSQGTVLASYGGAETLIGRSIPDLAAYKSFLNRKTEGTAEWVGLDGVVRINAYVPLYTSSTASLYVRVGIPKDMAYSKVRDEIIRTSVLLALIGLTVLAVAWYGSSWLILRRINVLANAATRMGQGDFWVRTGLPHTQEDIGQLAHTFDNMAAGLQRSHRALRALSAANRTLVRAQDENSLLHEMCKAIVEVGGYRMAWVGFTQQDQDKSIRPVAHWGFEDGYLDAIKVSWGETEHGRGPMGTAIRTGVPCAVNNVCTDPNFEPWRRVAQARNYTSIVAYPLRFDGDVVGALAIYAAERDAFGTKEIELLGEMADDLALGLATLRLKNQHEQARETIRQLAYHDKATGLPNRAYLKERLEEAINEYRGHKHTVALLVLDVNRFRDINEAVGFVEGDKVLQQLGQRLQGLVDERQIVARVGADEFAILLPRGDADYAGQFAHRIRGALAEPIAVAGLQLDVHVSIGAALYPEHAGDPETLLRLADTAMHLAKREEKDYALSAGNAEEESQRRLAMIGDLRRGIDNNHLLLYFQPKIATANGAVTGAEALVRWQRPGHGMVPPVEFIPLAEHTGLIKPLTYWVLEAACRQINGWRKRNIGLALAINLSTVNLRDPKLLDKIKSLFAAWEIAPDQLQVELTESTLMEDPAGALTVLKDLRDLGITLFVDDFGTGYSSLSYLQKLPITAIKIDRSFIMDIDSNPNSVSLAQAIISMAHSLGLTVVAEGVENKEQATLLRLLKCDEIQGYFISKPMPADQYHDWLTNFHPDVV
jgi:diguanylate cyclase (GGDEF)-like protein